MRLISECQEWGVAAAVTGGVTMFLLTGPIASPSGISEDNSSNSVKGLLLLLLFLALDGITSPMQEKLFKEYGVSKSLPQCSPKALAPRGTTKSFG